MFVAFSCIRVVNTSQFTVFPVFGLGKNESIAEYWWLGLGGGGGWVGGRGWDNSVIELPWQDLVPSHVLDVGLGIGLGGFQPTVCLYALVIQLDPKLTGRRVFNTSMGQTHSTYIINNTLLYRSLRILNMAPV